MQHLVLLKFLAIPLLIVCPGARGISKTMSCLCDLLIIKTAHSGIIDGVGMLMNLHVSNAVFLYNNAVLHDVCLDLFEVLFVSPWASYQKRKTAGVYAPGTFSPPPQVSDPDIHHGTCVTHVPQCMPRSPTSGFLWSRRWGKRSRHSRRMHNPQFYVFGKRPIS